MTQGSNTIITEYRGSFQYTAGDLDFFPHAEGYVKASLPDGIGGGAVVYNYVFNYTDHLGNIRLRYAKDPSTNELAILEEDHYYPFGLKHNGYNGAHQVFEINMPGTVTLTPVTPLFGDSYKYKFGGKELQTEFGIEMYDFGMRNYDPALGRWMNIDPLAELSRRYSPYAYALDNPVYFIDPDGMEAGGFANIDSTTSTGAMEVSDFGAGNESGKLKSGGGSSTAKAATPAAKPGNSGSSFQEAFAQKAQEAANTDYSIGGGCPPNCDGTNSSYGPPAVFDFESLDNVVSGDNKNANVPPSSGGGFAGASYQFALAGGFSFNVGVVWDDNGGLALYYGAGALLGLAASVGIEGGNISATTPSGFTVDNFAGTSAGYNFSLGPVGYGTGGTIDTGQLRAVERMNVSNFGDTDKGYKTNSGSLGKGGFFKGRFGAAATWSQNHTSILKIK